MSEISTAFSFPKLRHQIFLVLGFTSQPAISRSWPSERAARILLLSWMALNLDSQRLLWGRIIIIRHLTLVLVNTTARKRSHLLVRK